MISSKQYSPYPKQTHALLSIKPDYAYSILRGLKKYEYRRRIFAKPVKTVVVYVTHPIMQVLFEFDVVSVIKKPIELLWKTTGSFSGISREIFADYFVGVDFGYAIKIGNVRKYRISFPSLLELKISPPQSYIYLPSSLNTLKFL